MKANGTVVFAVALLGLGCGSGSDKGPEGAAALTQRLATACHATSNMGETICACVAKKAGEDLSPDALEFLVASLEKNEARVAELRGGLSMTDATQAGMFMVTAPAHCAQGSAR
jgi:hypothetical protein